MALNAADLDQRLNSSEINQMTLHSGDPGAAGDQNVVSAGPEAVTWATAELDSGTKRKHHPAAHVTFAGCTPSTNVVNFGLWATGVYRGYIPRTTGDPQTNVAGNYTVTTATKITADNDP